MFNLINKSIVALIIISTINSCAMMYNNKETEVSITSSPPGAQIYINGLNYGTTPKSLEIYPDNYQLTLVKEGYQNSEIQLESWITLRRKPGEFSRCLADSIGFMLIIPIYSFVNYCKDFKQASYHANLTYIGGQADIQDINNQKPDLYYYSHTPKTSNYNTQNPNNFSPNSNNIKNQPFADSYNQSPNNYQMHQNSNSNQNPNNYQMHQNSNSNQNPNNYQRQNINSNQNYNNNPYNQSSNNQQNFQEANPNQNLNSNNVSSGENNNNNSKNIYNDTPSQNYYQNSNPALENPTNHMFLYRPPGRF